jgi:hypothetical protein
VFVMTLGYSRHQYAELVFDQTVRTWIACHRQAFAWFGGMPRRLVIDNLKAGVLEAALHDPVLGEAYRRMAQHYGVVVSPTRPRTPEHKGKVENGVHFVKRSFLAGHAYADLRVANEACDAGSSSGPDARHGRPTRAAGAVRGARAGGAAAAAPRAVRVAETRSVKVHPDRHVVIDGSYYWCRTPGRSHARRVRRRKGGRAVSGTELTATHPTSDAQGSWQTRMEHHRPKRRS